MRVFNEDRKAHATALRWIKPGSARPAMPSGRFHHRGGMKKRAASVAVQRRLQADVLHAGAAQPEFGQAGQVGQPRPGAPGRGQKWRSAAGSSAMGCIQHIAPDLEASGPMPGPTHARQAVACSALARIAARVCSSTPPDRPRQPAWAAPSTRPSTSAMTTGRRSATITASTRPGQAVTLASSAGSSGRSAASASTTSLPC